METEELLNKARPDGADEAKKTESADERRQHQGRRKDDGQTMVQFLDLHPGWMKFILFCQSIKHGKIESLQIQDGLPSCIEKVKEKIKFLAVLYWVLKVVDAGVIDVPFI